MKVPETPPNEQQRLAALQRYEILDTLPEQEFDDIAQLAADICGTSIALISLVDESRQWFKARVGLDASEMARDVSFCGHVVSDRTLLVVPDATQDSRFADNPLVQADPAIRFYAGAPLLTSDQHILGALCVIDRRPHVLTPQQLERLQALSRLVISQLELRRSEQIARQLAAVVESSNDAIITETLQGTIVGWNQAASQMLGYTDREVLNQPAKMLYPAESMGNISGLIERIRAGEKINHLETLYLCKDGSSVPVSITVSPIKDNAGQIVGASKIIRDVTENRNFTQALERNNQFLELVLNTIPLSIFWKDSRSIYQGCNWRWAIMAGLDKPDDVIGMSDDQLPWTDEQRNWYLQCDRQVLTTGQAMLNIQQTQTQADGQVKWRQVNKVPMKDSHGHVIGLIGTIEDITERKQAEAALHHTNQELMRATRLKDEFLANMSHELRTPLNAVLGMTEALQEQVYGEINSQQMKALQTVEHSGSHLLELINDILDIAKIESGQVELHRSSVAVEQLCQSSLAFIQPQATKKRIVVTTQISPNLPKIVVDERRIRQALINLLTNAVKFTPAGGRITLEASCLSEQWDGDTVRISVIDTGIGISANNMQTLFQPFVQIDSALNRQYEGTGLGLALVKRFVELHNGRVGVTSEVNVGSCFSILLPLSQSEDDDFQLLSPLAPIIESGWMGPSSKQYFQSPLILLAEDNEASIRTLASYLQAKGCRMELARNGQEAIALAHATCPDLILMDLQMPGIDGVEAMQQIRQHPNLMHVPMIMLSAMMTDSERDRCLKAGATDCLTKPVKFKRLTAAIQQYLMVAVEPSER